MAHRDCDGCIYFHKYYGNKNKQGKRMLSKYFCSARNESLKKFPTKCEKRKDKKQT